MMKKIKNMWKYRNGCPKDEPLESIDWSLLDVRLQAVYGMGFEKLEVINDEKFHIIFRLSQLRQLSNFVLNNNIRELLGDGWKVSAVNKSLDGKLNIWYEKGDLV